MLGCMPRAVSIHQYNTEYGTVLQCNTGPTDCRIDCIDGILRNKRELKSRGKDEMVGKVSISSRPRSTTNP